MACRNFRVAAAIRWCRLPGDPQRAAGFAQAFSYLETITTNFIEHGPWWTKTTEEMAYELTHHNNWGYSENERFSDTP